MEMISTIFLAVLSIQFASCQFGNTAQSVYPQTSAKTYSQTYQQTYQQQPNGKQTTIIEKTIQQPSGASETVVTKTVSQSTMNQPAYSSYGSGNYNTGQANSG